jgi:nifR3 family TIM-barrel protein
LKIGNIELKNNVFLAPMAGVTDIAYRLIAKEMGAGLVYTEMISAEALVRDNQKTLQMLKGIKEFGMPTAVQIFGSNATVIASAIKIIDKMFENIIIDINMGCPAPKIAVTSKAGSALLKDIKEIKKIVKEAVKVTAKPITVKIRSGWNKNSINALEVAKAIEKAGASAITIHPRTRSEQYSGKADLSIIKLLKENLKIPVIGNGDIRSCFDAENMLLQTACDAVMIGRGTLGNPWLIKETIAYLEKGILPQKVTLKEKQEMILKHFDLMLKYKSEKETILEMRKEVAWYLKGLKMNIIKEKIMKCNEKNDFIEIIKGMDISEQS